MATLVVAGSVAAEPNEQAARFLADYQPHVKALAERYAREEVEYDLIRLCLMNPDPRFLWVGLSPRSPTWPSEVGLRGLSPTYKNRPQRSIRQSLARPAVRNCT